MHTIIFCTLTTQQALQQACAQLQQHIYEDKQLELLQLGSVSMGCQLTQSYVTMCSACAGAIQSVQLTDCRTAVVTGYVQVPVYAASNATITLSHINGTVGSPCGGVFGASQASQMVQIRQGSPQHAYPFRAFDSMQGAE